MNTYIHKNTRMEIIIDMLLLYLTRTVYRERHRMAREFALTRAKLSLPKISLLTSDLGRPCLVDKRVASIIIIIIPSLFAAPNRSQYFSSHLPPPPPNFFENNKMNKIKCDARESNRSPLETDFIQQFYPCLVPHTSRFSFNSHVHCISCILILN